MLSRTSRSLSSRELSVKGEKRGYRPKKGPLSEGLWLGIWVLFLKTWKLGKRFYVAK